MKAWGKEKRRGKGKRDRGAILKLSIDLFLLLFRLLDLRLQSGDFCLETGLGRG